MKTYLLDSDILIDHLRRRRSFFDYVGEPDPMTIYGCSVIIFAEVLAGMRPSEEKFTRELLDSLVLWPVTSDIAEKAAGFIRHYRHRGITLALDDCLIAGTAAIEKAILVTLNAKDYPMLDDVISKPRLG